MKVAPAIITVALAGIAGCATQAGRWTHREHQDDARFQRDANQCVYESNLATASAPNSIFASQQVSQDVATGVRQVDLQRLCMQARGYEWQVGPATLIWRESAAQTVRSVGCTAPPIAAIQSPSGNEIYKYNCADGRLVTVRCSAGSCAPL